MINGKSKLWALALLLGVLSLGVVAGALVDRSVISGPACTTSADDRRSRGDRDRGYLDWLSAELALTVEQRSQVEQLIDNHRTAVRELWREMRPRYEERKAQLRSEIREVLNAEQAAVYDALLEKDKDSDRRRRRHED